MAFGAGRGRFPFGKGPVQVIRHRAAHVQNRDPVIFQLVQQMRGQLLAAATL